MRILSLEDSILIKLPSYIKRLVWGHSLFFFKALDICVHAKSNSFKIVNCSTGEELICAKKAAGNFIACDRTQRLFFSHLSSASKFCFSAYDVRSATLTTAKKALVCGSRSVFLSSDGDCSTIIVGDGDILCVENDSLNMEVVMKLSDVQTEIRDNLFTQDGIFRVSGPWYKTKENVYETIFCTIPKFCTPPQTAKSVIITVNLADKSFFYAPISEAVYGTPSVYLGDLRIWVHHWVDKDWVNNGYANKTTMFFHIRRDGEIIWEFDIPCSPMDDIRLFNGGRNVCSFSESQFVICLSKAFYLCDIEEKAIGIIMPTWVK